MSDPVTLTRLHDWQLRLAEFVRERRDAPFAWGEHDCCIFAADCVRAITGHDFAAPWRGTYATAAEAARLMGELGGVEAIATAALGEPLSPLMANVGDVVLVDMDGREALALCNGTSVLGPSAAGLRAFGMDIAKKAWRVGHA